MMGNTKHTKKGMKGTKETGKVVTERVQRSEHH